VGDHATRLLRDENGRGDVVRRNAEDDAASGVYELVFHDGPDVAEIAVREVHAGVELVGEQPGQAVGRAVAREKAALEAGEVDELGGGGKNQLRGPGGDRHVPRHLLEIGVGGGF